MGLTSVDGLSSLTSVGDLVVYLNPNLTNLDGFSSLSSVGWLELFENESLCPSEVDDLIISLGAGLGSVGPSLDNTCPIDTDGDGAIRLAELQAWMKPAKRRLNKDSTQCIHQDFQSNYRFVPHKTHRRGRMYHSRKS